MTYALRQQFQEMDRSVQADERQKLADLAATQKRNDEAAQRRILSQAPAASFDLPDGYQFGSQNQNAGAPGVPNVATGGGSAYKSRAGVGRQQPTENQSAAESSRLARQAPRTDVDMDRLANLRRQQMMGSVLKPEDTQYIADNRGVGQTTGPTGRPMTAPPAGRNEAAFQELQRLNAQPAVPGRYANPEALRAATGNMHAPAQAQQAPLSVRNNNPGNLKFAGQPGATSDARGFAVFQSPEAGAAAADRQLALYMQRDGLNTVNQIVGKWSPVADPGNAAGSTANYAAYVARQLGVDPNAPLSQQDIPRLRQAMAQFEAGTTGPSQGPQQAMAPQPPEATFSGMGPGGSPQMLQEQIQMAQFRYSQLSQMLQNAPPEQQEKIAAEMRTLHAGARAQQAYMLAAQADANPQALGQLVALAGAQAARTQDGRYVVVDSTGKPLSQPLTGGQLGAYLFQAMDAKSREARADMQGKIALEQAKALAQAQGKLLEQGGTTAEVEQLKALMQAFVEQSKSKGYGALMDPMKGLQVYNKDTGQPSAAMQMPDTVTIR